MFHQSAQNPAHNLRTIERQTPEERMHPLLVRAAVAVQRSSNTHRSFRDSLLLALLNSKHRTPRAAKKKQAREKRHICIRARKRSAQLTPGVRPSSEVPTRDACNGDSGSSRKRLVRLLPVLTREPYTIGDTVPGQRQLHGGNLKADIGG